MSQAVAAFLVLALLGAGLLVAGTFLLAGLPWALLAGGVLCFGAAGFIKAGLSGGAAP